MLTIGWILFPFAPVSLQFMAFRVAHGWHVSQNWAHLFLVVMDIVDVNFILFYFTYFYFHFHFI